MVTVSPRTNLSEVDVESYDYHQTSAGPRYAAETHAGDDVVIFARGPSADLFHATHEQTYIAYVMAYSACIGPYAGEDGGDSVCQMSEQEEEEEDTHGIQ